MTEKCYSSNEEDYTTDDFQVIEEAVQSFLECEEEENAPAFPRTIQVAIWEADSEPFTVGRLFCHAASSIIDQVGEHAYELVDDHADGWHANLVEKEEELQAALIAMLEAFLPAHDLMPDFWTVANRVRKTYAVKLDADGEVESYEEVTK